MSAAFTKPIPPVSSVRIKLKTRIFIGLLLNTKNDVTTGITGNHKIASIVKNRIIQFLLSTFAILLSNWFERFFVNSILNILSLRSIAAATRYRGNSVQIDKMYGSSFGCCCGIAGSAILFAPHIVKTNSAPYSCDA